VAVPWLMLFALNLGIYEPFDIQEAPLTRVLFESEKDCVAAVEGKVIFDLERYLLLLTENKTGKSVVAIPVEKNESTQNFLLSFTVKLGGSIVAIPHEKIKSVQTPPMPQEQVSAGD
jgi:hypothetical protein